jgi:hypothetical protein
MISQLYKAFVVAACAMWLVAPAGAARGQDGTMLLKQIQETIAKIRATKGPPSMARTDAAEHLSDLTERINPAEVDDKTIEAMASLLDTSDCSVLGWVAGALGNLGPRAKVVAPKLLTILPKLECLNLDLNPAAAIRVALKRMGVNPPPKPKCNTTKWKTQ